MSEYLEVTIRHLPTEQGGRTHPIFPRAEGQIRYLPHFRVGPAGEHLGVTFLDGSAPIPPGSEGTATIALIYDVDYSPLQPGTEFEVLEGPHCVATGKVIRRWSNDIHWHDYHPV